MTGLVSWGGLVLYFYKTPIILLPEILNDGYTVYYHKSDIMSLEEMQDHYFHNKMVHCTKPLSYKDFISGDFTYATTIPDLYAFVREWFSYLNIITPLPQFSLSEWFRDYLTSKKIILDSAQQAGPALFNYYDKMTLQEINKALDKNDWKQGGECLIDFTGLKNPPAEYSLMVADYIACQKNGKISKYGQVVEKISKTNEKMNEFVLQNLRNVAPDMVLNVEQNYLLYNNFMGLSDGRINNFVFINKCMGGN